MIREHRHSTGSPWEPVTVLCGWDGVHTDILSIIRVAEDRIGQAWMRLIKESFVEQVTYRDWCPGGKTVLAQSSSKGPGLYWFT